MTPIHYSPYVFQPYKEMRAMCIEEYTLIVFFNKVENNMILKLNENLSYQKDSLNLGLVQNTDNRNC